MRAGTTAGTGHRATLQRPKRGLTILLDVRTTGARSAGSVLLPYPDPPPGG
ncbi:MAG: hypothetical protein HZB46_12425 [Solirubrobacterales bacterium]|nr:hypothetical protein [Solirubrobacterales bacterium]